jgi:hypothetical protein
MGNAPPATKSPATLRDLCERAKLGEAAKALLKDELTPRQFLELLIGKELFLDAVRFLAYALPKREAVGWGCLCVRHSLGTEDASKISEAHVAAQRWVSNPDEGNRQAAKAAADKEGLESPSAFLALAAFLSGGSIAPANLQPVAPPDHATPQLVAGAVMASAVKRQPEKAPEKYRVFLQKGMALMARMHSGPKPA